MCPPAYFAVTYAINPWMRPDEPADAELALRQWTRLRETYLRLGHTVYTIEPHPELPDMVFAANGAAVIDGTVLGVRFRHPERAGEAVLAGYGFRSDEAAAGELAAVFGRRVVSLRLVDPRFYHLDTALSVLDASTAMYYPAAFDDAGRAALSSVFDELIEAKDEDAEVLGLNAVSDGRHVVLAEQATALARQLAARGFVPVPVDMSELRKAGGGAKCCTLELRG
jgi:N-dimethylarginine dimethylaminohydrolase